MRPTARLCLKIVAETFNPSDILIFPAGFAVVRPRSTAHHGFIGCALRNDSFISEVSTHSAGASHPAIDASDLFQIKIAFPPLAEQHAISVPLDEKCNKLDEAARIKQVQIALLRERGISMICSLMNSNLVAAQSSCLAGL